MRARAHCEIVNRLPFLFECVHDGQLKNIPISISFIKTNPTYWKGGGYLEVSVLSFECSYVHVYLVYVLLTDLNTSISFKY